MFTMEFNEMKRTTFGIFAIALVAIWVGTGWAKKQHPPAGMLAASAENEVVVVNPSSGESLAFATGPVAWLFPAPGGTLFAPDLVHGKTAVIDLLSLTAGDTIDGVTMPRFGSRTDRYVVVSKQLLVVSYPERALMNTYDIEFQHPWQTEVLVGNTILIVLERLPDGDGDSVLSVVQLTDGTLVYRRLLRGDIRHFAVSPALGLLALADATSNRVTLADPATLTPAASFEVSGTPVDLLFVQNEDLLVVAVEREDGAGEIDIWKIKFEKKEGWVRKKEWKVPLAANPVRLAASPDFRHVAAGLENAQLQVFEVDEKQLVVTVDLPGPPRDLVWTDPFSEGPLLPDWSDKKPPEVDLSDFSGG
jgi:hypothetical protein